MKKYITILLCLSFLVSCKNTEEEGAPKADQPETEKLTTDFEVYHEKITPEDIDTCQSNNCPQIKIEYLKIKTPSKFGKHFNQKNTDEVNSILNITQEDTVQRSIELAVDDFIQDYFKFKAEFPDSPADYEAEISQEILNRNDRLVVLKTDFYIFTGGAHGYGGTHYLNFDSETGRLMAHKDLISDKKSFTDYAEKRFRQKFEIGSKESLTAQGYFFDNDQFALPENIAFLPEKVILLYNPYEAASYAQGQIEMEFSKSEVGQWLNY